MAGEMNRPQSGYRGVSKNYETDKWEAVIPVNGDILNLGGFDDPKDAAIAWDTEAEKHPLNKNDKPRETNKSLGWLDNPPISDESITEIPDALKLVSILNFDSPVTDLGAIMDDEESITEDTTNTIVGSEYHTKIRVGVQRLIRDIYRLNPSTSHLPGETYFIALPNGRIKIGCVQTADSEHLINRWRYAERHFNGQVIPICTVPGGLSKEAILHVQFDEYRVYKEFGEQFAASNDIWAYALWHGHTSAGKDALMKYMNVTS